MHSKILWARFFLYLHNASMQFLARKKFCNSIFSAFLSYHFRSTSLLVHLMQINFRQIGQNGSHDGKFLKIQFFANHRQNHGPRAVNEFEGRKTSRTEFGQQMRSGGMPAYLSLNRLSNGIVLCSCCYFVHIRPTSQKFNSCVTYGRTDGPTDGRTDGPTDGRTDGHTLL